MQLQKNEQGELKLRKLSPSDIAEYIARLNATEIVELADVMVGKHIAPQFESMLGYAKLEKDSK